MGIWSKIKAEVFQYLKKTTHCNILKTLYTPDITGKLITVCKVQKRMDSFFRSRYNSQ